MAAVMRKPRASFAGQLRVDNPSRIEYDQSWRGQLAQLAPLTHGTTNDWSTEAGGRSSRLGETVGEREVRRRR